MGLIVLVLVRENSFVLVLVVVLVLEKSHFFDGSDPPLIQVCGTIGLSSYA
jgi:hypothetical protein